MNKKLLSAIEAKKSFLKTSPSGFLVSSMCAGGLIAIGILISMRISYNFADAWGALLSGVMFSIALNLIVIWRLELFTGNAMITALGVPRKIMGLKTAAAILAVSYFGNLLGVLLITALSYFPGLIGADVLDYISEVCILKLSAAPQAVFFKGVFCNILICAAILASYYLENECAKIFVVTISITTFMCLGFEHSIADMAALSLFAYRGGSLGDIIPFLINVSLGNLVGGALLVAAPYAAVTAKK